MCLIAFVDGFCWLYLLALVIVFVAGLAVVWIWCSCLVMLTVGCCFKGVCCVLTLAVRCDCLVWIVVNSVVLLGC